MCVSVSIAADTVNYYIKNHIQNEPTTQQGTSLILLDWSVCYSLVLFLHLSPSSHHHPEISNNHFFFFKIMTSLLL